MKQSIFLYCLGLFALASCSVVEDEGNPLPDGNYPMTFTAAVDGLGVSRGTTDNSWTGGEEVAIQIDGEVKKYAAASGGNLSVAGGAAPFYWQSTDITVNAWYPYSDPKPTAADLRVKANQSEGGNYQASDYLEVADAAVSFKNPSLIFKHRTAKAIVTLAAGEGMADVADATVTFVNQNGVEGDGTEVTPKKETSSSGGVATYTALVIPQQMQGKQFIKVSITTNGVERDYYYTPTGSTDANLEAGKQYTYTITVKKTGLEVTVTGNGTAWTDTPIDTNPDAAVTFHITAPTSGVTIAAASSSGGTLTDNGNGSYTLSGGNAVSITATSIYIKSIKGLYEVAGDGTTYTLKSDLFIAGYTLEDARVGDFYCKSSDGTTGYLIPGDIASLTDAQQQSCIGIVYSTDASRIGKEATEVLKKKGVSTPHGLVMALTDASSGCQWGHNGEDENSGGNDGTPFKANCDRLKKQYENVDGYAETHWIINTYNAATLLNTYAAFYHANRYGTTDGGTHQYAVPANVTTGWFIPSIGQWWDILSNLGGVNLDKYKNDTFTSGVVGIPGTTTTTENINKYLRKIKDAKHFSTPDVNFWSSSEYDGIHACSVYSSDGLLCLNAQTKNYDRPYVRCTFAF